MSYLLVAVTLFYWGILGGFDYLMPSRYRWFRRLRRGVWYAVTPRAYPYIHIWVREPLVGEHVDATERW